MQQNQFQSKNPAYKALLTHKYSVALIAVFCSVLWGSAFPVLKLTYEEMALAPGDYGVRMLLAALRFILAGLVLLVAVKLGARSSIKIQRPLWPAVAVLGTLQIALQYFFFYNGLAHTTGMKGAILQSCGIFFVVVLAHFVYRDDRINWRKIVGLVTGFGGIILINRGQEMGLQMMLTGEGFLILSGLVSAIAMILAKKLTADINTFVLTGWQMLIGGCLLLIAGFWTRGTLSLALGFNTVSLLLLFYSVFLSAAAFSLWYAILQYNKAGEISIYRFIIPVSGAILSAIFIPGENMDIMSLQALVLVSFGIMVVNYAHPPKP